MKSNNQISALEEDILTLLLGRELYGAQIIEAISDVTNGKRRMGVGTLYPTLSRMEKKGYVTSRMDMTKRPERGGARRKYYKISALGAAALTDIQDYRRSLASWELKPIG